MSDGSAGTPRVVNVAAGLESGGNPTPVRDARGRSTVTTVGPPGGAQHEDRRPPMECGYRASGAWC